VTIPLHHPENGDPVVVEFLQDLKADRLEVQVLRRRYLRSACFHGKLLDCVGWKWRQQKTGDIDRFPVCRLRCSFSRTYY